MRRRFDGAALTLAITSHEIVRFPNRPHNSLVPASGFDEESTQTAGWAANACGSSLAEEGMESSVKRTAPAVNRQPENGAWQS